MIKTRGKALKSYRQRTTKCILVYFITSHWRYADLIDLERSKLRSWWMNCLFFFFRVCVCAGELAGIFHQSCSSVFRRTSNTVLRIHIQMPSNRPRALLCGPKQPVVSDNDRSGDSFRLFHGVPKRRTLLPCRCRSWVVQVLIFIRTCGRNSVPLRNERVFRGSTGMLVDHSNG